MRRRLWLSGLGLSLGLNGSTVLAQTAPTRAAQFGRPVALVETAPAAPKASEGAVEGYDPNDPVVTQAGLFSRPRSTTVSTSRQAPLTQALIPSIHPQAGVPMAPAPVGVPGFPTAGAPVGAPGFGAVMGAPPAPMAPSFTTQPVPMPMPNGKAPAGPSVTEVRDGTPLPTPTPLANGAVIVGGPTMVLPGAPPVSVEDPFFSGGMPGQGQRIFGERMNRLFGGGIFEPRSGPSRYWASAEYIAWWTRNTSIPVLATTTITPGAAGFLGEPGTIPVLGGENVGDNPQSGFRVGMGWWFDDCQKSGIDAHLFWLGQNNASGSVSSETFPQLTRPFFNVNQGIPFGEIVAFPGFSAGGVAYNLQTDIWGADVNYRRRLDCGWFPCARLDGLVGYRYLSLKDSLNIDESFIRTGTSLPEIGTPGVVAGLVQDQFRTDNQFHGGQIGLNAEVRRGRWYVDSRATIAFGATFQSAEIYGAQNLVLANGGLIQSQGALLTAPGANIGKFSQNKFAVLPEVGVNVGYHLTNHLRAFVGFNFLYLSSVLRAGDVVDTNLDVTRIPNFPLPTPVPPLAGRPRPAPILKTTDFTAMGINFGMAYAW